MTDKKYSGLGSRIVLGTLKSASSSDDEDIFLSDSIADRPELRVQLRYFTVELKPSRCGKNNGKNVNTQSGENVPPNEATSSDSFHSCRSTTSIQEVACKDDDNHKSVRLQSQKLSSGAKKPVIRDDDLLNHLTMVNAIFLSKNVSSSTQHDNTHNKTQSKNNNDSCKTEKLNIQCVPSSSNNVCSEAYTCQINHNPRVKYISKIYGHNVITKPVINSFDTLYDKIGGDRLSYSKTFSESFEPVLNCKKSGFELVENFNAYDRNDLHSKLIEASPSDFVVQRKCSKSSFSTSSKLEVKVPEMKFAEIIPLCDDSFLPVVLDQSCQKTISSTDQRKRRNVPGCEDSLPFSSPKNSLSLLSVESKVNVMANSDTFQGDGDFSDYSYTENSGMRSNKLFLKDIDDKYLRMLISKSFKKIGLHNGSESALLPSDSDESDIFESDEEHDVFSEYKDDVLQKKNLVSTEPSLQLKKRKLDSCFQTGDHDVSVSVDLEGDRLALPLDDEYDRDSSYSEQDSEMVTRQSSPDLVTNRPKNTSSKRGIVGRTRTLPVIQEESSEEFEADLRDDDLADDYCLIDSNGRPIHLFDDQGLPLTDNSGRPLRSAQGKLLMQCDQHGIPVVDDDGRCSIYDMFGRQPHDDRFDPSMAPKMAACSKLSAGDGRPLLLYDAQGRPLTSVSGTMLTDSSGRGLVRLSTAAEAPLH